MESTGTLLNNLYTNIGEFINLKIKSVKLDFYERATNFISEAIHSAIIIAFSLFSLLFISVGLAFWLSEIFQSYKAGFSAVGSVYLSGMIIYLIVSHKKNNKKIKNAVLNKLNRTMENYDLLVDEQLAVDKQLADSETAVKQNFEEVKTKV